MRRLLPGALLCVVTAACSSSGDPTVASSRRAGTPNAVDLCARCHFPKGWVEDRSDPPNATKMPGADYDGVQCDFCHKMYDPHFEDSYAGTREGSDWSGYWDEATAASQTAATRNTMRLNLTLTEYSDIEGFIYNTGAARPALDMSLKKIPDGTMTGTLDGRFAMTGELEGEVVLALAIAAQLEPDPADSSKVRRKPGTITVTGTATSAYGTYAVDLKL